MPYFEEVEDLIAISYGLGNEHSGDEDVLKEWNPMHIAIFYNNIKVVMYFSDSLKVNIGSCIKMPG